MVSSARLYCISILINKKNKWLGLSVFILNFVGFLWGLFLRPPIKTDYNEIAPDDNIIGTRLQYGPVYFF